MSIPYILPKHFSMGGEIYNYVEGLVSQGVNSYRDLDAEEKQKISALIIRELGADDFESLTGCDNTEDTMQLFANALYNNDPKSDKKLLDFIKMNAIANHGWEVDELISEIKSCHKVSKMLENNFISYTDKQTGELCWRKQA
jgi:hypothetical protein